MPFCAPPTDRTEAIVPVQIGGSVRFAAIEYRSHSASRSGGR
jgi:hypothetical protein